jgi:y4mF family transcriptional regulator
MAAADNRRPTSTPGDIRAWMASLGGTVRRHRKLAGLTRSELAQLAGVGKTVVFDLEQGKTTMRMATVLRLLAALNIRLGWTAPTGESGDA